jgi:DNA-binding LytR/AlgR family response regulator
VKVTINGYTYRNTIAVMGGRYMVGVAAEHRQASGVAAGDTLTIRLELDDEPRTVEIPSDLARALKAARASEAFERLAYTHRKEHVRAIEDAKKPETRARRIAAAVEAVTK